MLIRGECYTYKLADSFLNDLARSKAHFKDFFFSSKQRQSNGSDNSQNTKSTMEKKIS